MENTISNCDTRRDRQSEQSLWPGSNPEIPNSVEPGEFINYFLAPGETLIQCPYSIRHRIRTNRMGRHILKCRSNYARRLKRLGHEDVEVLVCKYSDVHLIPKSELVYHENQCSERFSYDELYYTELSEAPTKFSPFEEFSGLYCEIWNERTGGSYNHDKKVRQRRLILQPNGLTREEKEEFLRKKAETFQEGCGIAEENILTHDQFSLMAISSTVFSASNTSSGITEITSGGISASEDSQDHEKEDSVIEPEANRETPKSVHESANESGFGSSDPIEDSPKDTSATEPTTEVASKVFPKDNSDHGDQEYESPPEEVVTFVLDPKNIMEPVTPFHIDPATDNEESPLPNDFDKEVAIIMGRARKYKHYCKHNARYARRY